MIKGKLDEYFEQLAKEFERESAEARNDYDGQPYLSIPVGVWEAIEVERETPHNPSTAEYPSWLVFYRAWDRTHGLANERLLVQIYQEHLLLPVLKSIVEKSYADAEAESNRIEAIYHEIGDRINEQWSTFKRDMPDLYEGIVESREED